MCLTSCSIAYCSHSLGEEIVYGIFTKRLKLLYVPLGLSVKHHSFRPKIILILCVCFQNKHILFLYMLEHKVFGFVYMK